MGYVRFDKIDVDNPTLKFCLAKGMDLIPLSSEIYGKRNEPSFSFNHENFNHPYFIPEGGASEFSNLGCQEIIEELDFVPDYIVLPIGTGGTMSSLINTGIVKTVLGISPFKEGKVHIPFLHEVGENYEVIYDFALKGYGRFHEQIVHVINSFWEEYGIPLDPIYNAKGIIGLRSLLENNFFKPNSKIVYLHTGGLQGIAGFDMLYGNKKKIIIPRSIYFPEVGQ